VEKLGVNPIGATKFMNRTYHVSDDPNEKYSTFVDLLLASGLVPSKSEAKRVVESGGCYINGEQLKENRPISTDDLLHWQYILIRRGKKLMNTRMMVFNNVEEFFKNEK
jgi:tyrosyl-tRNA synthetase